MHDTTGAEPAADGTGRPGDGTLIRVDAGGWGLTWVVDELGRLRQVGVGPTGYEAACDVPAKWYPDAFPTWGGGDPFRAAALRATHSDGTTTTRLVVDSIRRSSLDALDGAVEDGEHVVVTCVDEELAFTVEHHLRTHPASSVLEQWVEIVHDEPAPVRLFDYDSIAPLVIVTPDAELCQFSGGGWADEWKWSTDPLTHGLTTLSSLGGLQPHLQRDPCLLVSPFGPSTEHGGDVLGLSIAWGGNIRFDVDVRPNAALDGSRELRLRAGANPMAADYVLDPGARFVTPTVAWIWSASGRRSVTAGFHRWTLDRVLRDPQRVRPIVSNNWESTFFDFDESRIVELIDRSADVGAELFLLDDGWFGTTFPRDDDTTSLGDWDSDPVKLPTGLAPLAQAAVDRGIRFGIWLEPEMVNPVSELHDAHPDWVLRDRRPPREHRHQFALDPLRADVREFEAAVFDRTLAQHPGITYVKWDANRPITDPGSGALPADRQSNLWVDHVLATWSVMDEVVARHPEVELMLCASGGGRCDHGTLRRFHEFWTSDNTDPVTRVRMQWACSHFFPASVMAAHVTRWGERPMDFACAVALSGRFGLDLDLSALDEGELAICRGAVAYARRTQDLVQQGDLARLVSPVEGADTSRAAVSYTSRDRRRSVVFAYQLEAPSSEPPRLRLHDLDPSLDYEVFDVRLDDDRWNGRVRSGASLRDDGLHWQLGEPCTATIWDVVAVG